MGSVFWIIAGWVGKKIEPYAKHFVKWGAERMKFGFETPEEASQRRYAESMEAIAKQLASIAEKRWVSLSPVQRHAYILTNTTMGYHTAAESAYLSWKLLSPQMKRALIEIERIRTKNPASDSN